ncbi:MAG: type II toxin-antitoxin system VapC family toxin [Gemmatimonadota bacterium]
MKKYVLDTNLYINAFRSVVAAEALRQWYLTFAPVTYLSSIVFHELLVGANTPAKTKDIRERIAGPLVRTGRLMTPSHAAWQAAGEAIARMADREKRPLRNIPKSLVNDYLLAASCREAGMTLITDNVSDFERIRPYVKLEFRASW